MLTTVDTRKLVVASGGHRVSTARFSSTAVRKVTVARRVERRTARGPLRGDRFEPRACRLTHCKYCLRLPCSRPGRAACACRLRPRVRLGYLGYLLTYNLIIITYNPPNDYLIILVRITLPVQSDVSMEKHKTLLYITNFTMLIRYLRLSSFGVENIDS